MQLCCILCVPGGDALPTNPTFPAKTHAKRLAYSSQGSPLWTEFPVQLYVLLSLQELGQAFCSSIIFPTSPWMEITFFFFSNFIVSLNRS